MLTAAGVQGHLQAMRRLVEEGANTTAFTGDGNTALNLAATQGQSDMVQVRARKFWTRLGKKRASAMEEQKDVGDEQCGV